VTQEDNVREISFSDNPSAREAIGIADLVLAPELWTSVESLIRSGRLTVEEFSVPVANTCSRAPGCLSERIVTRGDEQVRAALLEFSLTP
jgi:hypothetical protein